MDKGSFQKVSAKNIYGKWFPYSLLLQLESLSVELS